MSLNSNALSDLLGISIGVSNVEKAEILLDALLAMEGKKRPKR